MNTSTCTNLEKGALTKLVALTKARGLNNGKGFSYDYVKLVLNPNNKRTNTAILALAQEMVQAHDKAAKELDPTARPAPLPRMLNAPTATNLTEDPRWVHGDRMRLMILAKERGIGGSYVEQAILGRRTNSQGAKKHFAAFRQLAEEYFAARAAGKPLPVLSPTEELHALREENARLKEELEQANAERQEPLQLMGCELGVADGEVPSPKTVSPLPALKRIEARIASLEENAKKMGALLHKRDKELVALGMELDERQELITRLRRDVQAANDRAYRLEELLGIIRKTAKLATA